MTTDLPPDGRRVPFPQARYPDVEIERDIEIPMRDGVLLATDLYIPRGAATPLPAILIRTQYGKQPFRSASPESSSAIDFAGQGYAVVVQEIRGVFGSGGEFTLGSHDAIDGYDTLSWIASSPWSNGRVGTYGCSALGIAQVLLARLRHPAHACAIAQGSGGATGAAGNRYRAMDVRRGGAVEIGWSAGWFATSGRKDRSPAPPISEDELSAAMGTLPIRDIVARLGAPATDWADWISHDPGDPWWDAVGFLDDSSEVDVPTLFVNSWYDLGAADALHQRAFFEAHATSAEARENQCVLLSPAVHCQTESMVSPTVVGDRHFGDARLDCWTVYLDWFARWLQGQRSRTAEIPTFRYYTMGANRWRESSIWPPAGTEEQLWLLGGGGRLSTGMPDGGSPVDRLVHDPTDPVPSLGRAAGLGSGPLDHRELEKRDDVLGYTSEPLTAGLEVTGVVRAVLYVSSTAPDTDIIVRLLDVYPDGGSFDVVDGIIRLRYRDSFAHPTLLEPGRVYRVEVELDATSIWFPPGHRVRLHVASSSFPRYDRNLGTGGPNWNEAVGRVAVNSIHHSAEHPSHLILPVSPGGPE